MKKLFPVSLLLFTFSCSHMKSEERVVQFPYATELLQKVQMSTHRAPASLNVDDLNEKSPRRIYFSALYYQYLTLGRHLGKETEVKFCPQFHHDKTDTDSGLLPKVSLYRSKDVSEEGKNYFPEMVFSGEFSLADYHNDLGSEIETLCEDGISDNFYKFDNLVTHYAHKDAFHKRPEAMSSVLKIPVFANFYLIKMLEIPGMAMTSPEEHHLIRLTRTHWFQNYVAEASKIRNNMIKNKMVRR